MLDTDTYSVSFKDMIDMAGDDNHVSINVNIELKKFDETRTALVFSTRDGGSAKWLLGEYYR